MGGGAVGIIKMPVFDVDLAAADEPRCDLQLPIIRRLNHVLECTQGLSVAKASVMITWHERELAPRASECMQGPNERGVAQEDAARALLDWNSGRIEGQVEDVTCEDHFLSLGAFKQASECFGAAVAVPA